MTNQTTDRDLLALEPAAFTGGGFDAQQLAAGTDGAMSGATFTDASANFPAAGVQAGMVLCVYESVPEQGRCCEIVSVDSATQLTVSMLRADPSAAPIAPPPGTGLRYFVLTFAPQIAAVRQALLERLAGIGLAEGVRAEDFADSVQLRRAVTLGALAAVFTARASHAVESDANWVKAEFYRAQHAAALAAVRLASDLDGDGFAERTRTLGNVRLRRD